MSLPPDVSERPLAATDADGLIALVRACDETYLEWAPAGWTVPEIPQDFALRMLDRWTRVAVDAHGVIVGAVSYRPAHDDREPGPPTGPPLPGVAHLGIVFAHPARWREGVAGALLDSAEAAMVGEGYVGEQLWTPEGAPAECFYAARGWARDGRRAWHPWVGLPVVGYSRALV